MRLRNIHAFAARELETQHKINAVIINSVDDLLQK